MGLAQFVAACNHKADTKSDVNGIGASLPRGAMPFAERSRTSYSPRLPACSQNSSTSRKLADAGPGQRPMAESASSRNAIDVMTPRINSKHPKSNHPFWSTNFSSKGQYSVARPAISFGPPSHADALSTRAARPTSPSGGMRSSCLMPADAGAADIYSVPKAHGVGMLTSPTFLTNPSTEEPAVLHWTAEELASSLATLGNEYAPIAEALLAHHVDGRWVPKLNASTLPSLGVRSFEQVGELFWNTVYNGNSPC